MSQPSSPHRNCKSRGEGDVWVRIARAIQPVNGPARLEVKTRHVRIRRPYRSEATKRVATNRHHNARDMSEAGRSLGGRRTWGKRPRSDCSICFLQFFSSQAWRHPRRQRLLDLLDLCANVYAVNTAEGMTIVGEGPSRGSLQGARYEGPSGTLRQ
jgi:hypothetical protein